MTHCAKCGAELIGSRKFCAACGTPAGDPRSPAASTGAAPVMSHRGLGAQSTPGASAPGSAPGSNPATAGSSPSIQYAPPPASQVNPFAQTANPITHRQQRAPDYGPPPSIPAELGNTSKGVGEPGPHHGPSAVPAPSPYPSPASPPAPQVSPLAISNVSSQRGAFENAVTSGPASTAAVAAGLVGVITHPENAPSHGAVKRSPVAGTQMMPSSASPGPAPALSGALSGGPPSAGSGASSKRQDRTQLLGAFPSGTVPRPGSSASSPGAAPSGVGSPGGAAGSGSAPPGAQSAGSMQAADPQRISSVPNLAAHAPPPPPAQQPPQQTAPIHPPVPPPHAPAQMQPPGAWSPAAVSFPVGQPSPALPYGGAPSPFSQPIPPQPIPAQPPMAQPPMAQPPPPAPYGYGFAYVPGSRVTVTWSNGGRYPGTVQQVSGTQCLVVFPDGQQHWIEMQYVAPA